MDGANTWAEIDEILASIDPNRAPGVARMASSADHQEMSDSGLLDFLVSLEDWAALNRLEEVVPCLLAHGFDCASFIHGVLSDSDLHEIGVRSSGHRRRVLAAVQDLPKGALAVAESLSPGTSVDWMLERLRLGRQLGRDFADGGAPLTVDELVGVTDAELRQRFNVRKLGHRRRILCCLDNAPALAPPQQRRFMQQSASGAATTATPVFQNGGIHRRQSSGLSARSSVSSSAKSPSTAVAAAAAAASVVLATNSACGGSALPLAFDSTSDSSSDGGAPRLPTGGPPAVAHRPGQGSTAGATLTELLPRRELLASVSRSWVSTTRGSGGVNADDEDLVHSAPVAAATATPCHQQRLLQLPRSRSTDFMASADPGESPVQTVMFRPLMRAGWPHHPDVLLKDSFSYSVSYLGFRPLVDHTDQTEISQVMQTFRCKSADILKLPRIRLTVCYRGVKFINPDNDMVITEHRITEIYFASQDNTRRANFAYVTKDSVNSVHYCHCFASHSPDTAVLIIQTLSEACGLANQLIEFNQVRRTRQRRHKHGHKPAMRN